GDAFLGRKLYISYSQVFFYFLTFGFIPFVTVRHIILSKSILISMKKWFLYSAFLFSSLATWSYAQFIGRVGRLTSGASSDDLISPLILSYCSAIVLGVTMNLLLTTNQSLKGKSALAFLALLSLTPFFLGASRGSI